MDAKMILKPAPIAETETAAPCHVAIIMDGNGRWAKARAMPRTFGHRHGADAVRRTVEAAAQRGIEYLTLYAFSSENWSRPATEINDLMGLLRRYIRQELVEIHANNIRVLFIGDRGRLAPDIRELMQNAERQTIDNTGMTLILALNYGSKDEIVAAVRNLAEDVAAGQLMPEDVNADMFSTYLQTSSIPDPDLVIRTSGEQRLSNFLLWQAAYSELIFVDTLWPDFGSQHLDRAIADYRGRERRFGKAG